MMQLHLGSGSWSAPLRAAAVCVAAVLGAVAPAWAQSDEARASSTEEAKTERAASLDFDPAVFDDALEDFHGQQYASAAAGFWSYVRSGDESSEKYEWAQFFLAESLRELGLVHGAVQYYYVVAKTRSRPEILPEALARLEHVSRTRPFSESLIYEDLLYDSEFGLLPQNLSDWVQYVQGLYDYRFDFVEWGNRHFEQISPQSPYALKAQYVKAVYALKKQRDDEALGILDVIVNSPVDAQDVKNRAHLALARLLFDIERYADAMMEYEQVVQIDLSFEQAQLLLEKAWVSYHLGDFKRAMGLLHALKAPSYARFFLPDAFVLRGLILKQLCHFIPAKRVVREFRFAYNRALDDVRRRVPLENIRAVTRGATQDGDISRRTDFLRSLQRERELIDRYDSDWEDAGLDKHLRRVYDLEMREQARLWRADFDTTADAAALELLESEEQVNLLDYEIGLDIFKRLKAEEARRTAEEHIVIPYDSANVYYEFDTEFWNDELHSYQFFINSRCFESEAAR